MNKLSTNCYHKFLAKQISFCLLVLLTFVGPGALVQQLEAQIEVLSTADTNNVAIAGEYAFAAAGSRGVVIVDLSGPTVEGFVSPPGFTGTIDDVSIDGDLLFTLDAAGAGGLSVFSIADPTQPTLLSGPFSVQVSPFAGVSAANGRVVVSGGTGLLSSRSYQADGTVSDLVQLTDLGIGQPDVLVAEDGLTAFVSTDFSGFFNGQGFGITVIDIDGPTISILDRVGIAGAGFSPGASSPANFPIESAQSGDMLFVASGNGVSVFDTSNPSSLQTLAVIPLNTNPVNIDVAGDTLYVVGSSPTPTLTTIDISVLGSPVVETTTLPPGSVPRGVAATDSSVVIADANLGVLVESLLLLGDVNRDGEVNFFDIAPFIEILSNDGFQAEADIDQNGAVNFLDIAPFIEILSAN